MSTYPDLITHVHDYPDKSVYLVYGEDPHHEFYGKLTLDIIRETRTRCMLTHTMKQEIGLTTWVGKSAPSWLGTTPVYHQFTTPCGITVRATIQTDPNPDRGLGTYSIYWLLSFKD